MTFFHFYFPLYPSTHRFLFFFFLELPIEGLLLLSLLSFISLYIGRAITPVFLP